MNNRVQFYKIIDNISSFNRLSHAYLIEVDNYEDDYQCVLDFVKLILCGRDDKNSKCLNCGKCNICSQIDSGNYVDLKIIEPDGNLIRKKQMTSLQEEFNNKSLLDNKRIYIIKEADKFNDSSANTILKFLEEPEDDIVAILLTTNRYLVIETILSRCQILSLKKEEPIVEISNEILDLLDSIVGKNKLFINYNDILTNILPDKVTAKERLIELENILISYLKYLTYSEFTCNSEVISILSGVKSSYITNLISIIESELKKLEYNINYKLWLDSLFAKMIGG